MSQDRTLKIFYGYVVVLVAFLVMTIAWGTIYSFGIFFKPVMLELGWTRATTAGAFSLCILTYGSLGIAAGRLTDRFGPRVVTTGCGLLMGSGYLLMSQISTVWQLYVFYGIIIGMGLSCTYPPSMSTVARWFVKRRGLMSGIAVSGIGFGTLIVPPIANWLVSSYGWRNSYLIIGIVVFVLIILAAQFIRRDPDQMGLVPFGENLTASKDPNQKSKGVSFHEAAHNKQFWKLCMMLICYGFIAGTVMVHIAPHATDLTISTASAASIIATIGGVGMVGRIAIGSISERIGNKTAMIICFIMLLVALLWLLAAKDLWMFVVFAITYGLAYGGLSTLQSLIMAELFGLSALGIIIGFANFSTTLGESIGPALAGRTFDITNSYQPAFLVCIILSIVATLLAFTLRSTTHKRIRSKY